MLIKFINCDFSFSFVYFNVCMLSDSYCIMTTVNTDQWVQIAMLSCQGRRTVCPLTINFRKLLMLLAEHKIRYCSWTGSGSEMYAWIPLL